MKSGDKTFISVVIPTYGRDAVLVDSLRHVLALAAPADELLVIDQTPSHEADTETALAGWENEGRIRWIRIQTPGVVGAINRGLREAKGDLVLFLDDDIVPSKDLVIAHRRAHEEYPDAWAVAGRVLQPGGLKPIADGPAHGLREDLNFDFGGGDPGWIANVMAGNLSVKRAPALAVGGFDEHFVPPVSFRFETDFAKRIMAAGGKIWFEPAASIQHLRAVRGGTRIQGGHLTSASPTHGVGDYYYALKHGTGWDRIRYMLRRPFREVCTQFHLRQPWWIPVKLVGETRALFWAFRLFSHRWKENTAPFPIVGSPNQGPIPVVLIHTCAPDRPNGSMVRYGAMVREALTAHAGDRVRLQEINLAPRQSRLDPFPVPLQTGLRYLCIAWAARRRLPKHPGAIWHLLDGSHAYALSAVRQRAAALVMTIHDTIPLLRLQGHWPEGKPGRMGGWLIRKTAANWARADSLITVSANTRADVIRQVRLPQEGIAVVHHALASGEPSHDQVTVQDRYILHVAGNNTFYKNRRGVVDIVKRIREMEPVRLVMAGAPPDARLEQYLCTTGMTDHVVLRPDRSEQELAALYRHAAFLLFPSLYEGFGWPPLEAMREGCPVLCSNAGSLPEIVGEAAWLADPQDIDRFAGLGVRLLRDATARSELIERGRAHVQQFNLESLAAGVMGAYGRAVGRVL